MPHEREAATRSSYDAVARSYADQLGDELAGKPFDRALLAAYAELAGPDGPVGDVGCGPGHVTAALAGLGCRTVGIDLSPAMVEQARARWPALAFEVGSMLDLPVPGGAWSGAIAFYSIIHLGAEERAAAFGELARVVRPGGPVLVAFHVSDEVHAPGETHVVTELLGEPVDLVGHFLDPATVGAELAGAGFVERARLERAPHPGAEYPSRRCYLLGSRA